MAETIKNGNGKNQSGSQTSSNPSNSTPRENSKLFLGIVIGVSVMAILGGLAFFLAKKKKKTGSLRTSLLSNQKPAEKSKKENYSLPKKTKKARKTPTPRRHLPKEKKSKK